MKIEIEMNKNQKNYILRLDLNEIHKMYKALWHAHLLVILIQKKCVNKSAR